MSENEYWEKLSCKIQFNTFTDVVMHVINVKNNDYYKRYETTQGSICVGYDFEWDNRVNIWLIDIKSHLQRKGIFKDLLNYIVNELNCNVGVLHVENSPLHILFDKFEINGKKFIMNGDDEYADFFYNIKY